MDASTAREIEEAVRRSLAAGGVNGAVTLTGRTLSLRAGGAPVEIDALYLLEQWPLLPEEMRQRKAAEIAARLVEAHRAAAAGRPAPAAPPRAAPSSAPGARSRKPIVIPLGAIFLVLVSGLTLALWLRSRSPSTAASPPAAGPATSETDEQRRVTLCEKARRNVLDKGTFLQVDAQSAWIVELWLATSKQGADLTRPLPALIHDGKLTAAADPELAALSTAEVEIAPAAPRPGPWQTMIARFRGAYVSEFFDRPAGRDRMNAAAARIADATGAELGALYGKCAHMRYHDVGAWFRGSTPQGAATALVYAMGLFSEQRLTNRDPSAPPDLTGLAPEVAKLDKAAIESAVRGAGGAFTPGSAGAPSVITFPLFGPRLALQTSGALAKAAGIGPDSPR